MEHFIKNIEIANFKSIRHAEIKDCRRVNIFVGYPNVGKSNILEAIATLSYIQDFDENLSSIVRVKGYSELFYNGDINNKSEVTVLTKSDSTTSVSFKYVNEKDVKFTLTQFVYDYQTKGMGSRYVKMIDFADELSVNFIERFTVDKEITVKSYSFNTAFNKTKTTGASLLSPNGANLFDVIELNLETKNEVKNLFNNYNLKLTFDKNDNQIKLLKALEDDTFYLIPFHQIADTLQRLIFYKTAILSNNKTSLLFEEPEAHMFPPYISQLTSDIIQDKNQNQFFIATHSPFVLNDFMEDLENDELSIYAVGLENGETTINRMTDEQVTEVYQYGIDLFFNLENYLKPKELVKQ